jgi:hypothetical protein
MKNPKMEESLAHPLTELERFGKINDFMGIPLTF